MRDRSTIEQHTLAQYVTVLGLYSRLSRTKSSPLLIRS